MSTNHTAGHWLLPIIPSLIIIYISSLNKIIDRLNWQYLHYTKHIFCAYILIHTTLVGFDGLNKQFLLPDTKYMAKEWIESNLPESTKVAMDRGRYLSTFNANLIPNDSSIKRQLQKDFTIDQDFLTSNGKIFIEAQRFHPF